MLIPYEHVGQLIQINESGDMYAPADINTAILFTKRDFTNHYKSSYYFGIVGLYTFCANEKYEKCVKIERQALRGAYEESPCGPLKEYQRIGEGTTDTSLETLHWCPRVRWCICLCFLVPVRFSI